MTEMPIKTPGRMSVAALAALGAALALSACGSSGGGSSSAESTSTGASSAGGLEIGMGDDFYKPTAVTAKAGKIDVSAVNNGAILHELVLAKTDANPADLPTAPDGSVDEEKVDSPGEIPDVAAGETKSTTFNLKPGKYVMFCNIPGHYAAGMYGSFIVK